MESVAYEQEQSTEEIIEENSSNLPDKDDNETASFKGPGRRSRKSGWIINRRQTELVKYEEEEDTAEIIEEKSSNLPDKDDNETASLEGPERRESRWLMEEEHGNSGSFIDNSSTLSYIYDNETILTESSKLEMECLSNSNSKLKRKLSEVKFIVEVLQDRLKRFKSS